MHRLSGELGRVCLPGGLNNESGGIKRVGNAYTQIYYIWYGAWGNLNNNGTANRPTTVKVLTDMAQSMGGKPWYSSAHSKICIK